MYIPASFREDRLPVLHDVIRQNSFGTLVSTSRSGLMATHLPFVLDPATGAYGTLAGHVARANPHWRDWTEDSEVLVIFQGPHGYVSPRWYVSRETVPTWNYVAVHAYGTPRLIDDADVLLRLLRELTAFNEAGADPAWEVPWPAEYIEKLMRAIVGFRLEISRLEGKFKLGQNRQPEDAVGVIEVLRQNATPNDQALARLMAEALDSRLGRPAGS